MQRAPGWPARPARGLQGGQGGRGKMTGGSFASGPVARRRRDLQGGSFAVEGNLAGRTVAPHGANAARGGVVAKAEPGNRGILREVTGAGVQFDELRGLAGALKREAGARGGARGNGD